MLMDDVLLLKNRGCMNGPSHVSQSHEPQAPVGDKKRFWAMRWSAFIIAAVTTVAAMLLLLCALCGETAILHVIMPKWLKLCYDERVKWKNRISSASVQVNF